MNRKSENRNINAAAAAIWLVIISLLGALVGDYFGAGTTGAYIGTVFWLTAEIRHIIDYAKR